MRVYCWLYKILTLFWYFRISRRATVPGLNLWGFLTPETSGADFLAIFWAANCFLGTFWAVDFLAVCFVRAICLRNYYKHSLWFGGYKRIQKLKPLFSVSNIRIFHIHFILLVIYNNFDWLKNFLQICSINQFFDKFYDNFNTKKLYK